MHNTPLPWFISYIVGSLSMLSAFVVGKRSWWGWTINMVNVCLIGYINLHFHLYNLTIVNAIMFCVFFRNAWKWHKQAVLDRGRLKRTVRFCFSEWGWEFNKDYYDGPFWNIRIGWLYWVVSFDGLPYIFQRVEIDNAEGNKASLSEEESSSS